jgi:hypothetical protein
VLRFQSLVNFSIWYSLVLLIGCWFVLGLT